MADKDINLTFTAQLEKESLARQIQAEVSKANRGQQAISMLQKAGVAIQPVRGQMRFVKAPTEGGFLPSGVASRLAGSALPLSFEEVRRRYEVVKGEDARRRADEKGKLLAQRSADREAGIREREFLREQERVNKERLRREARAKTGAAVDIIREERFLSRAESSEQFRVSRATAAATVSAGRVEAGITGALIKDKHAAAVAAGKEEAGITAALARDKFAVSKASAAAARARRVSAGKVEAGITGALIKDKHAAAVAAGKEEAAAAVAAGKVEAGITGALIKDKFKEDKAVEKAAVEKEKKAQAAIAKQATEARAAKSRQERRLERAQYQSQLTKYREQAIEMGVVPTGIADPVMEQQVRTTLEKHQLAVRKAALRGAAAGRDTHARRLRREQLESEFVLSGGQVPTSADPEEAAIFTEKARRFRFRQERDELKRRASAARNLVSPETRRVMRALGVEDPKLISRVGGAFALGSGAVRAWQSQSPFSGARVGASAGLTAAGIWGLGSFGAGALGTGAAILGGGIGGTSAGFGRAQSALGFMGGGNVIMAPGASGQAGAARGQLLDMATRQGRYGLSGSSALQMAAQVRSASGITDSDGLRSLQRDAFMLHTLGVAPGDVGGLGMISTRGGFGLNPRVGTFGGWQAQTTPKGLYGGLLSLGMRPGAEAAGAFADIVGAGNAARGAGTIFNPGAAFDVARSRSPFVGTMEGWRQGMQAQGVAQNLAANPTTGNPAVSLLALQAFGGLPLGQGGLSIGDFRKSRLKLEQEGITTAGLNRFRGLMSRASGGNAEVGQALYESGLRQLGFTGGAAAFQNPFLPGATPVTALGSYTPGGASMGRGELGALTEAAVAPQVQQLLGAEGQALRTGMDFASAYASFQQANEQVVQALSGLSSALGALGQAASSGSSFGGN